MGKMLLDGVTAICPLLPPGQVVDPPLLGSETVKTFLAYRFLPGQVLNPLQQWEIVELCRWSSCLGGE